MDETQPWEKPPVRVRLARLLLRKDKKWFVVYDHPLIYVKLD